MTLVSDIIHEAYRESNLIAIGTNPSGAQSAEGLRLLNSYVLHIYDSVVGERTTTRILGDSGVTKKNDYYFNPNLTEDRVPTNTRLALNLNEAKTVYLNSEPQDGEKFGILDQLGNLSTYNLTVNANSKNILTAPSVTFDEDGEVKNFMFRSDTGNWHLITTLDFTDLFPFPEEFDTMFAVALAARLNPRNNTQMDPISGEAFRSAFKSFQSRYSIIKEEPSELWFVRPYGYRYDTLVRFDNG